MQTLQQISMQRIMAFQAGLEESINLLSTAATSEDTLRAIGFLDGVAFMMKKFGELDSQNTKPELGNRDGWIAATFRCPSCGEEHETLDSATYCCQH